MLVLRKVREPLQVRERDRDCAGLRAVLRGRRVSESAIAHTEGEHKCERMSLTYLCVLHADEDVRVWRGREVAAALGVVEEFVLLLLQVDRPRKVLLLCIRLVEVEQTCQCVRMSVGYSGFRCQETWKKQQSDGLTLDEKSVIVSLPGRTLALAIAPPQLAGRLVVEARADERGGSFGQP